MSLKVELNLKGTSETNARLVNEPKGRKWAHEEEKALLNYEAIVKPYKYVDEDVKLINSPVRIPKSSYPVKLYVNHDVIDLTSKWGWLDALSSFCEYCALEDEGRYLELGGTKRSMGLCLSRTKEDLLVNLYADQKKIVNWWGVWFNLNVPTKRDLGVAIFSIGDFMGFKYVAMEVKKWDNSAFE